VSDLITAGGPQFFIEQAERKAGDEIARLVLEALVKVRGQIDRNDTSPPMMVEGEIRSLRRRLGVRPTLDEMRAKRRTR
jgi:hypothetical protein